jgi:hypothetical protein
MTTLSIHPIEYFRDHVDHALGMKKLVRFLMLIGFTLCIVGIFYGTLDYNADPARDLLTQTYMNAFPSTMPDVMLAPAGSFAHIAF